MTDAPTSTAICARCSEQGTRAAPLERADKTDGASLGGCTLWIHRDLCPHPGTPTRTHP